MKQKLTTKTKFNQGTSNLDKYGLLHHTELRVQRLERIIESLLVWKEGSKPYEDALNEYRIYGEEK